MSNKHYTPTGENLIACFDLTGWTGEADDLIRIKTNGDPESLRVVIAIKDVLGVVIEAGEAKLQDSTQTWLYVTTAQVPRNEIVMVYATVIGADECAAVIGACVPPIFRFPPNSKPSRGRLLPAWVDGGTTNHEHTRMSETITTEKHMNTQNIPTDNALVPSTDANPPPPNPEPEPLAVSKILGVVDVLSEAEQGQLMACEAVIEIGWQSFVEVGLALAQIRDNDLYKAEFNTFQDYCRQKWQYGRNYVDRLISAAQVFTHLMTNSHQKPDHETQVLPLVGLAPDKAQLAWESAVTNAGGRKVTARPVKNAVQALQLKQMSPPVGTESRETKAKRRKIINEAIGQLLMLLTQKASYETLTAKVELLHGHFQGFFAPITAKASNRPS